MYGKIGRYVLMASFVLSALFCLYAKQNQLAAISGLFFLFIIWSHFKQSSVSLASRYFKDKDYTKTEKYLDEVPNPDRLVKSRRGYYEFMKGSIALQKEDFEAAEYHFQIASRFPVGGNNQKAYLLIQLANLALRKKDKARVLAYIARAKELSESSRTKEIIKKIENTADKLAD